jgi:hypothetical protein
MENNLNSMKPDFIFEQFQPTTNVALAFARAG